MKRSTEWVGYKVQLTEICSPGSPHLITKIETTHSHIPDAAHVARCQNELARRNLLPKRQFVDGSYMGSQIALESRKRHNIELVGPAKQNWHRQQVESGYDLSAFKIDWDGHFAICPQGKKSTGWWSATSHTGRVSIHAKFSRTDCAKCNVNQLCTKSGTKNSRKLALHPREEHEWLAASRHRGHHLVGSPFCRDAPLEISRIIQDAFTECGCRMRNQFAAAGGLLG